MTNAGWPGRLVVRVAQPQEAGRDAPPAPPTAAPARHTAPRSGAGHTADRQGPPASGGWLGRHDPVVPRSRRLRARGPSDPFESIGRGSRLAWVAHPHRPRRPPHARWGPLEVPGLTGGMGRAVLPMMKRTAQRVAGRGLVGGGSDAREVSDRAGGRRGARARSGRRSRTGSSPPGGARARLRRGYGHGPVGAERVFPNEATGRGRGQGPAAKRSRLMSSRRW